MHIKTLFFILSMLFVGLGLTMFLPLATGLVYSEDVSPLLISMVGLIVSGLLLFVLFKPKEEVSISNKDAIIIVSSCWFMAGFVGAIPYMLGFDLAFEDAFFESVSGFTTTGSSILSDVEILPKWLLMWRALTHWLGGMGIIVLTLAILPMLGMGGMQLYKAEVTGPQVDKLVPRIHDTALYLWMVYFLLTVVLFVLLLFGGMDWFDSLTHTFATVATGGFSTKNASITNYSPYIQWVIAIAMFIAGANFTLHYRLLAKGKICSYKENTEFKVYTFVMLFASIIVAIYLYCNAEIKDVEYAIRTALFQIISIGTSTGFATDNYVLWSMFPQTLILFVMIMGASAGSTGGGVKIMRFVLLYKYARKEVLRVIHPRAVRDIKYEGKSISNDVLTGVVAFLIIYLIIVFVGGMFIALFGHDFATSFSASISAFSNTGPGFGEISPVDNFGFFEAPIKYFLCIIMLIGRLEIFTILLLFLPTFWKN